MVTTCPQNLVATANYSVPNPPVYDATAQSGFFRFEFVKPDTLGFGFGERYYADVLNQVTLENTVTAGLLVKDGKDGNGGDGDEDPANGDNPEAPEKKDRKGPLDSSSNWWLVSFDCSRKSLNRKPKRTQTNRLLRKVMQQ